MDTLQNHIQEARQHGQTDEDIMAALIAAGWQATQVYAALSALAPAAPTYHTMAVVPPKTKNKRLIALTAVVLVAIIGLAGLGYYLSQKATPSPSVTLYYDDDKTVLWQDNDPAIIEPSTKPKKAPYFVNVVRAELQQKYGNQYWEQGAWKITTSLDPSLQAKAESLVASNLTNISTKTAGLADQEAVVLEDVQTGQIKALVGGTDYSNPTYGQINYATSRIEPGSSIKPFDYAALIDNTTNTGAGTGMNDSLRPLPGYPCTNRGLPTVGGNCLEDYDFETPGTIPLRYALGGNRNIPAVEAMLGSVPNDGSEAGVKSTQNVINLIDKAGADGGYNCYQTGVAISNAKPNDETQCYTASALGQGAYMSLIDETHVLSTLANNGKKVPQAMITTVSLNGKVKIAWQNPVGQQIIKPDTAYIINDIMSDPNASYLPGSCTADTCTPLSTGGDKFQRDNGWDFAVDSGTTNNGFSASMASWSTKYAVVSWIGNHTQNADISEKTGVSPESLTIPLTRGLMEAAHSGISPTIWSKPSDIKTLPAFVITNHIHYGDVEPSPATDLYPSWYNQQAGT
jgi:membrane peptidoglycan carboxypeptidase